jgi:penicillin-binding protein 2
LRAARKDDPEKAKDKVWKEIQTKLKDLEQIVDKCTYFGLERSDIEDRIKQINDKIWNLRTHLAWKRNFPDRDFKQAVPDPNDRLLLAARVDIAEMHKSWPLLELKTDDDIFTAQLEFLDIADVNILPRARRSYPYGSAAAQTIGWVGRPQKDDEQLFAKDKLSSYLDEEVCGREDGVEYVCESILRGRRGEELYDIDRILVNRTETRFGEDVSLTLDIELQQRIEEYLADCNLNPDNCKAPTAAVVIDVAQSDILALVSTPVFDLNRARYDYAALAADPNEPFRNRAIYKQYPPGSAVKPLILIAGLESGKITSHEIIPCPPQKAPRHWPSCWIFNRYGVGHDGKWDNYAHNAIMGSCNIYFSRLADRIEPLVLQRWLFNFGYGHEILHAPAVIRQTGPDRNLRQDQGYISSHVPENTISSFDQLPPLKTTDRRLFGIGQSNLRVTPLQVANAFAAIARGGLYKSPRLLVDDPNNKSKTENRQSTMDTVDLNISPQTLAVIHDGMSAVVSEPGGTAYKEFAPVIGVLAQQGIKVYGKTGSTEKPDHAWFAGFATDSNRRSISIAVVVEGGQHGSKDAAPLARDIIQFSIEAGYIGQTYLSTE